MTQRISRRDFLRAATLAAGAATVAACAPAATQAPAAPAATQAPAAKATEPAKGPEALTLPIVKEKINISYWVDRSANAAATRKSFGEMTCYVEQEKRTNIHIDFQHPPSGQATEQFNLLVASGKYPDVIEHGNWPQAPGGPAKYLKDGVIIKLNSLIDQYAPNFSKVLADHPEWKRMIMTDEGDIYCFPFLRGDITLMVFQGPIIRKDWLDKVGLKTPVTIDDWHTMLKAFKEKDPNGNGKADDIPMTLFLYNTGEFDIFKGASAFVGAWNTTYNFYQENGTIKYGPLDPQFKDFLATMAAWYKEGLIDPDFPSTDTKMLDAKVTGNQLGSLVQNTGGGIGKYLGLMKDKDPKFDMVAAPYPVLKAGDKQIFGQRDFAFTGTGAAISSQNKKVTETVKLLDYAYSQDGYMLFNFGLPGLTYNIVNGYPKYTDLIMNNPDKLPLSQAMGAHFRSSFSGPFVQAKEYFEQYANLPQQQESVKTWSTPTSEKALPPITPTQEESKKFATVMNDVNTRTKEGITKIITGAQPVDSWDAVIKDIKTMGIDDAIKIEQAALERYNKRK